MTYEEYEKLIEEEYEKLIEEEYASGAHSHHDHICCEVALETLCEECGSECTYHGVAKGDKRQGTFEHLYAFAICTNPDCQHVISF